MYLKSLTLRGFKSFASPTTLRFEPGITCVVGPNGSGKSNVVDALAWVMGEQGAKSLRGGKMEDVIFAGTSGRPPLGRAEVMLTIDNSDGALPIEYSEVTISRTMFRDGAGEYAINGRPLPAARRPGAAVRLRHRPRDARHRRAGPARRRSCSRAPRTAAAFIEEAAGVLKHRKRKEKALRKLDAMQANLTRLTDLTAELRRQLKPLGRQAEVARRAATIQADLRDARLRLVADDLVSRARCERRCRPTRRRCAASRRGGRPAGRARPRDWRPMRPQSPSLSERTDAAQQTWYRLSALPERVSAAPSASPVSGPSTSTPRPTHRHRARPEELGRRGRRGAPSRSASCSPNSSRPAAASTSPAPNWPKRKAPRSRPNARTWRPCGPRPTAARVWPGWPARWRPDARGWSRSTTGSPGCRRRIDEAVARTERRRGRVRERPEPRRRARRGRGRPRRAARPDRGRACGRPTSGSAALRAAERDAEREVAALQARIEALAIGLARKDGAAWLVADRSWHGCWARSPRCVTGPSAATRPPLAAALGAAADAVAADSSAGALTRCRRSRTPTEAGRRSCSADWPGIRRGRRGAALPGGARWARRSGRAPTRLDGAVAAMLAGVAVVDDWPRALDLVAARPDLRAVTRDGDLVGAGWVRGGSDRKPRPPGGAAGRRRGPRAMLAAAQTQVAERVRSRWPAP